MGTINHPGAYDCAANARPDEPTFTLLGRDPAAAALVGLWTAIREKIRPTETAQTLEAAGCANAMAAYCAGLGPVRQAEQQAASQALTQVAMELLLTATATMPPAMRRALADRVLGKEK